MTASSQSPEPGEQGEPLAAPAPIKLKVRRHLPPGGKRPNTRLRATLIVGTVWLAIIAVATLS